MSAAATQRAAMLAEFDAADADGVPEWRMIDIGGLYWGERLKELCAQGHPIGWAMVEGVKTYFLSESVVERTASDQSSTGSGLVNPSGDDEAGLIPRASTDGSLSNEQGGVERAGGMGGDEADNSSCVAGSLSPTEGTLFPTPSRSHFDDAEAA